VSNPNNAACQWRLRITNNVARTAMRQPSANGTRPLHMFSPAVRTTIQSPATGCRVSRSANHAAGAVAAVAIASRALRDSRVEVSQPIYRVIMGKTFNLIVQAVLLPGIWDTQCGFKLFRGDVAHQAFAHLSTDGFGYDPEVLYHARRLGVKIAEVPVVWRNSAPTKVSAFSSSLDMLKHVLRVRFRG